MNGENSTGLTKVAFIERWPSYRVTTVDRFHCSTPRPGCPNYKGSL